MEQLIEENMQKSLLHYGKTVTKNGDFMLEFFHSEKSWKPPILKPASIA